MNKLNDCIKLILLPAIIICLFITSILLAMYSNYQTATYYLLLGFIVYLLSPDDEDDVH